MSDAFMKGQPLVFSPSAVMTSTNTIKTQAFWMLKFSGCSFQVAWTGTPTGLFSIYVSNDFLPSATGSQSSPQNAGTWSLLPTSVLTQPAGSVGNTLIPIYASCALWIQLWYVNSSGTGAVSGTFAGKYNG